MRNKMNTLIKFIELKVVEILAVVIIVLLSFNLGSLILGGDLINKCHYSDIGKDDIWCENFRDWLAPHIGAILIGFVVFILSFFAIIALVAWIKWNWRIAKKI